MAVVSEARSRVEPRRRRKTVAVLLDSMSFASGAYEGLVRDAFHGQAQELGLNLLLVYGRGLAPDDPHEAAHNAIFGFLHERRVDGVVVVSTCLTATSGRAELDVLLERLAPLPVCSIGVPVTGVPTVLIDNRQAIVPVIRHLIEVHNKRRIAFLAGTPGNPEAHERHQAYRDVLREYGIPYDERLVEVGMFLKWAARPAMERILERCPDLDAVVSSNDGMAVGAIEALRKAGYHVPRDVAVTGFDDLALARLGSPPITTVLQPVNRMASAALELLTEQMEGRKVEGVITVPTEFLPRRSCGCEPTLTASTGRLDKSSAEALTQNLERLRIELINAAKSWGGKHGADAQLLIAALVRELGGEAGELLAAVDDLLESGGANVERCRVCQDTIARLREFLRPVTSPQLEDVWFAALGRVGVALSGVQVGHQLELDNRYLQLLTAGERVSVALDSYALTAALAQGLPSLGVKTATVSLFDDVDRTTLRPLVALRNGVNDESTPPFDAKLIFPEDSYPDEIRHTVAVFPLTLDAELVGVAAFDYMSGMYGYPTLRDNICAALRSIRLHTELLEKSRQHERSLQEKQATAKRIESLSVLAGGVAHDLNNSLGPLVALPDILLRELDALPDRGGAVARAKDDILSIQTAALRAVQTIKDLLTLGRRGRVPKEPIDLNRAVANAVLHGGSTARGSNTRVSIEATRDPLPLEASEAHVIRAVSNLVQNAMESSSGGHVVVKTGRVRLGQPLHGYETIDPGEYAVVSVSDDGSGIAEPQLPRIFEPFFSTKAVGERSGSGLGLAIVHSVVKEHSGFVDVTSVEGAGTSFSLYFPLAVSDRPSQVVHQRSPLGHARVLVLDDDPAQRRTAHRILSHLGYQVDAVASSGEAYERCMRAFDGGAPYDLLIFDVMLNEATDGLELCERIKERIPGQRALLVSGHAPDRRVERAVESGLMWLAKPYTASGLATAADQALRG